MKLKKSTVGSLYAIAERLRNGETIEGIAKQNQMAASTLRERLNQGGWQFDGTPMDYRPKPKNADPLRGPEFMLRALCAQTDPEMFFPEKGGTSPMAKAVCGRCPVRRRCLEWALDHREAYGIWGGKSVLERRAILRKREGKRPGEASPEAIREWARDHGYEDKLAGPLRKEIRLAYAEAHPEVPDQEEELSA